MTEDDFKLFKIWLTEMLDFNIVTVTFLKKDGSERVMKCTTSSAITQSDIETEPKKERKTNEEVKPVFDVDARAWRSFRWDSVKRIEFSII